MRVVRGIVPTTAGLIVAVWAAAAPAEIRSSVKFITYDVRGHGLADVWRDINRQAPRVLQNAHAQAETRIRYRWNVNYVLKGGGCVAARPAVDVMVTIVLPGWQDQSSAPSAAQAAWQRYIAEIRQHEDIHRAMAIETAAALDAMIRRVPRQASCNDLARFIDSSAERILAEERRRQTLFDYGAPPIRLPDMAPVLSTLGR